MEKTEHKYLQSDKWSLFQRKWRFSWLKKKGEKIKIEEQRGTSWWLNLLSPEINIWSQTYLQGVAILCTGLSTEEWTLCTDLSTEGHLKMDGPTLLLLKFNCSTSNLTALESLSVKNARTNKPLIRKPTITNGWHLINWQEWFNNPWHNSKGADSNSMRK